jgi:hypothetical protein
MEQAGKANDVEQMTVLLDELKRGFEKLRRTMEEITYASS